MKRNPFLRPLYFFLDLSTVQALVICLSFFSCSALALSNQCTDSFQELSMRNQKVYTGPGEELFKALSFPPRLERILKSGLIRRYWEQPEVMALSKELMGLSLYGIFENFNLDKPYEEYTEAERGYAKARASQLVSPSPYALRRAYHYFQWPNASGSIMKGKNLNTLNYTIGVVKSFETETLGGRSSKIGTGFSKFLIAILRAMDQELQMNPEITKVEIGASMVVNEGLYRLLIEWGFLKLGHDEPASIQDWQHNPRERGVNWILSIPVRTNFKIH